MTFGPVGFEFRNGFKRTTLIAKIACKNTAETVEHIRFRLHSPCSPGSQPKARLGFPG